MRKYIKVNSMNNQIIQIIKGNNFGTKKNENRKVLGLFFIKNN